MSPAIVKYPYGAGSVTIRIDRIDTVVVKPNGTAGGPVPPWIMEIGVNSRWFSIEYPDQPAADDAAFELRKLISSNASTARAVEVLQ